MLTAEYVRSLLTYDEMTGIFSWRPSGRRDRRGVAGSHNGNGYLRISIDGRKYYAHQLAWLYVHNEWPDLIDHIDGNQSNNKLSNLRSVNQRINQFNRRKRPPEGMYWDKKLLKWRVQIGCRQYRRHIGVFNSKKEAALAREKALETIILGITVGLEGG